MFVTHNYLPCIEDANIKIVNNICKYLLNNGIDVSILTFKTSKILPREETLNNQKIYRVKISFLSKIIQKIMKHFNNEKTYINRALRKQIIRLNSTNNIDFIIPVIYSKINLVSVLSASRKNSDVKFIPYFLDPFSTNIGDPLIKSLIPNLELEVYKKCSKAILTYAMYEENKTNVFKDYLYKMEPLHFPNIQRLIEIPAEDDIKIDKKYINCVYVGYTYSGIRSTKFIFELFKSCKNQNIVFHIVGGSYGYDPDFEDSKKTFGKRLLVHGKVSGQAAINAQLRADILINIGNSVTNMLPSKIFEYISAGKPIINTYKSLDCPSLKYTKKYPLCLDLFENNGISTGVVERFEKFCVENKGKIIPYDDIEKLYAEHTINSVGKKFLEILGDI